MMKRPTDLFAGYVPVLDNGYMRAITRHTEQGRDIAIYDADIVSEYAPYARKELRALEPEQIHRLLTGIGVRAHMLTQPLIHELLNDSATNMVLIDDDISRGIVLSHGEPAAQTQFETLHLRWDRASVVTNQSAQPDRTIESSALDVLFAGLYDEASRSSDWWRHVAAAIIDPAGTIQSINHNTSMPHEHAVNIHGDPRILSNRGSNIELSLFLHAEANCLVEAARKGIRVEGSSMYVTTFPCPNCAKMIAASGIKQLYYTEGYAMLDGQDVMKAADVEIIHVQTKEASYTDPHRLVAYPEKNPG